MGWWGPSFENSSDEVNLDLLNSRNIKNKKGDKPVNKYFITQSEIHRLSDTNISLFSEFTQDGEPSDSEIDSADIRIERKGYVK